MGMLTSVKVLRRGPLMPGPYQAAKAHLPTLLGKTAMERWVAWSRSVDDRLKSLAQLRTAAIIGCMW